MRLKSILLYFLFLLSNTIFSQDLRDHQLYWVVETNVHYQDYTIVRFYNMEDVKVHEVKIMGVSINIRSQKQRKILDQLVREYLERAILSAERTKTEHYIRLDERVLKSLAMKQQF